MSPAMNTLPHEQTTTGPPTGEQYLESLRDGRAIYFDGELVDDVTTHPAFATSARSVARLYDTLHDPEKQDLLTYVTPRGTRSHKFYKVPTSSQDLFESRDAIAEWARMSYGILSRGPDYKASLIGALAADTGFYGEFAPNVARICEEITDGVKFVNLSLLNPAGDRLKPLAQQRDVTMHVVKERDDGIVVRGARMISTGSAFSHVTFITQFVQAQQLGAAEEDFALSFFVPMNAPGMKFIGRPSYEHMAKRLGSPFDYPLSSRFDETDMSIVLDDVFIPWENVIAYRNPEVCNQIFLRGFAQRLIFHAAARSAVKLDFLCGLLLKAVEMNQVVNFRGVQVELGELIGLRHQIWALSTAMAAEPDPGPGGAAVPSSRYALQWRNSYGEIFGQIKAKFQHLLAGGLIQIPSSSRDFKNPESRRYLDAYWKGATATAEERVKLVRLIWDVLATEFGGRTEMHERNHGGSFEGNRLETYQTAQHMGDTTRFTDLVDQCMSEYDLDGWTGDVWPKWSNA
ncbi:4-hydroxyphenylacetate 3-hydroxylase family protein [Pseudonocardia parietis]|uniref:4-hydroxyphenylacetate 3-monooxygenase n=1 Tax=Pseudonocardia parietis TaxID=570936 RepID=A0ABS4VMF8_9PSEU|nr:4-hydroxyphenylacetate 3-hydroxylase N-terminal domain-containing protein [Pseudonocardia parietis]MBP2365113.1 4-hydroxyphenylacetate 3-monooxygenase [Pseudonocardia parietis]